MANNHENNNQQQLPLLILHRLPTYKPIFTHHLNSKYTLLDPNSNRPDPHFLKTARLILCVGPTPLTSSHLENYPSVECVISSSVGTDRIDLDACRRRGIRVTTAGESFSDDVADYAVGLGLDVMRRVSDGDRFVKSGSWLGNGEFGLGFKVSGKRVGIVGLGSIGLRVAKRLEAFGCSIAYNSRTVKSHVSYPYYESVVDLSSNSDILIVCCALTDETRHVINKDVMTALGKNGVIVNVGRGALIDEKELVQFLVRGEIGGAGLDVFEHEPHVPEELLKLDNVVLSPHKAVYTPESFAALEELVCSNLEAFFLDKPLRAEIKLD